MRDSERVMVSKKCDLNFCKYKKRGILPQLEACPLKVFERKKQAFLIADNCVKRSYHEGFRA